jgi:hypothetical protein
MHTSRKRLCRLALAVVAATLLGSGASRPVDAKAGDVTFPCSAFARNAHGGWRVLAPVTMNLGGMLYSPMVGTTLAAGATQHGIEMSDVLDQQCGNE